MQNILCALEAEGHAPLRGHSMLEGDADELTLTRLPEDLILAVARVLPCHVGLRSLASCCRPLRSLLRGSGWLELNFAERCAARGWRAPVHPELAPRGWEASASWERRYLSRIGSLPPPHADSAPQSPGCRTLVVSQKRSGGHLVYSSLRAALEVAADGDTVLVEPGRYEEGAPPVVLRRCGRAPFTRNARPSPYPDLKRGIGVPYPPPGRVCGYATLTERLASPLSTPLVQGWASHAVAQATVWPAPESFSIRLA